ncbi:hypothetical protein ACQJBY_019064 [Aegilops geniculata]
MDPNGSLTKDTGCFTSDEDYISYVSPLHEALRGTTAMPTLEEFQKMNPMPISTPYMNSMSTNPEPEESMFPFDEHSMNGLARLPSALPSSSVLVAPPDSASPFKDNFTVSPFMDNFTIFTMETHSAIQGSTLAIMDANLNSSGVFNISPVFEYSELLVSKDQKPYTILGPSSYEELCGVLPLVNQTPCTVPESNSGLMAMHQTMMGGLSVMFQQNPAPCTISTAARLRLDEYTCRQCNIRFRTPQAYGGHMSYHSKINKKILLG